MKTLEERYARLFDLPREVQERFLIDYCGEELATILKRLEDGYEGAFSSIEEIAGTRDVTREEWERDEEEREFDCTSTIETLYVVDEEGKIHFFLWA